MPVKSNSRLAPMVGRTLKVAWVSHFPIAWLPDLPHQLRNVPRGHPAPWQRVLLQELAGHPEIDLHVFAVARRLRGSFEFRRAGVSFHCLGVPGGCSALSYYWWETLMIRRQLKQLKPDIIHGWGVERGSALVASRLSYPYMVTMHGLLPWIAQHVKLNAFSKLDLSSERKALCHAALVTVESDFGLTWLRARYPSLEVKQIEHAPDWLFHNVIRLPELKPTRFLFVGSIGLLKGADLLLRGLDTLKDGLDFRLAVIGTAEGGFLDEIKKETSSALWDRIEIRSGLGPEEIAAELASATMVLFPTRVDNSPNAVKEAVVSGVPVVASAVGGITDYVLSGLNGLTFPVGRLEAFTRTVRQAADHPLFSRGQVDLATLDKMREYLSPSCMSQRFLAAYRRVVGNHTPSAERRPRTQHAGPVLG